MKRYSRTHALILDWLRKGVLDGVRVDHPDGLLDPQEYFQRLMKPARKPGFWRKRSSNRRRLPKSWPIAGTTGYDFIYRVTNLFVDSAGEGPLTKFYAEFTDEPSDFAIVVREKKGMAMRELLGSDVNRLTALFGQICERHRRHRDYTRHELQHVLREVISSLPVYRTYVRAKVGQVSEDDSRTITDAIESAKKTRLDLDQDLFDFFRDILLLRVRGDLETELVMRFQQLTGPVMAKGVEDTAFTVLTVLSR
jgi:(1->4)-alpha-D-glucan 1-alpha-D-glucosylmutase